MKDLPAGKSDQPSGQLIEMLADRLSEIVSIQKYENSDSTEIKIELRSAEQLKRGAMTMRNVDGEWIK